jgi:hypothetical protein
MQAKLALAASRARDIFEHPTFDFEHIPCFVPKRIAKLLSIIASAAP